MPWQDFSLIEHSMMRNPELRQNLSWSPKCLVSFYHWIEWVCSKSFYWNWFHRSYKGVPCKVRLVIWHRCVQKLPIGVYLWLKVLIVGILFSGGSWYGMIRLLVFIFLIGSLDRITKVWQGVEDVCLFFSHGLNGLSDIHRIRWLDFLAAIWWWTASLSFCFLPDLSHNKSSISSTPQWSCL